MMTNRSIIHQERDPLFEARLLGLRVPSALCFYIIDVVKERWPEAEEFIKDSDWAYEYANSVIKDRWPEAEPYILKNARITYLYARNVIKGRWPEAEKALIARDNSPYDVAGNYKSEYYDLYMEFLKSIGKDVDIWQSEKEIWD